MVGGDQEVSRFYDPTVNAAYDVQLRLAEGTRNDMETIEDALRRVPLLGLNKPVIR